MLGLMATPWVMASMIAFVQPQAPAEKPRVRDVTLTVTLTKDGKPLPDFPLRMYGGEKAEKGWRTGPSAGRTDSNGVVALKAPVAVDKTEVAFGPDIFSSPDWETSKGVRDRVSSLTLESPYFVPIDPGLDTCSFKLNVKDAVIAQLTLENEGGEDERFHIVVPGVDSLAVTAADPRSTPPWPRVFRIGCLQKSKPLVAFVIHGRGRVTRVPIPALEASGDLGVIKLPKQIDDGEVRVRVENARPTSERHNRVQGVVFVSTDGRLVRTYADSDPGEEVITYGLHKMMLPEGSFYVAQGMFLGEPEHTRLIERALTGEDLTRIGVKTVTVKKGEVVEVTIDDKATVDAILAEPVTGEKK